MTAFLDTSVLLAGMIDFGPQSAPAQSIMHAAMEGRLAKISTAWHCCLEFYSVATRLPPEYRLTPDDATRLLEESVFKVIAVHDLPSNERGAMLRAVAHDKISGGRVYDAHIAEVARSAGAAVIVTDNRRHFLSALRYDMRVETPAEFFATLRTRR